MKDPGYLQLHESGEPQRRADDAIADFVENMVSAFERGEENIVSTEDVTAVTKASITAEKSARRGGEFLPIA